MFAKGSFEGGILFKELSLLLVGIAIQILLEAAVDPIESFSSKEGRSDDRSFLSWDLVGVQAKVKVQLEYPIVELVPFSVIEIRLGWFSSITIRKGGSTWLV